MKPSNLLKALQIGIKAAIDHTEDVATGKKGGFSYLIVGPPGVGKSEIMEQACANEGVNLIISHPVVSDPVDYKGLPFVVTSVDGEQVAEFMPFGELLALIQADRPTVFFLDDLGQAPKTVQAACMQLLLARRINGHKVSDHVIFMAATNRREDKAGVSGILEPVKSRFVSIINLEPDLDDWVAWANDNAVPPELVAFLRFRPNLLMDFNPSRDMVQSPCPRTITHLGYILRQEVPRELEYEMIQGAVGEGFAAEFLGFLRTWRDLPDPDLVLQNPETATVPSDPATLFALCGALSHRVDDATMQNLVTYCDRLPAEFSVLCVKDAINRNEALVQTTGFIEWARKHTDVVI